MRITKLLALLVLLFAPVAAWAQGGVVQAGPIVPGHTAAWGRNGVLVDGGTQGVLSPMCVNDVPAAGPSPLLQPYHQTCLTATVSGGQLTYTAINGAPPLPFDLVVNGISVPVVPPQAFSSPVCANNAFNQLCLTAGPGGGQITLTSPGGANPLSFVINGAVVPFSSLGTNPLSFIDKILVNPSLESSDGQQIAGLFPSMPIQTAPGASVSPNYLGEPSFPMERFRTVGHSQMYCNTLGWVDATNCLEVTANAPLPYQNQGNQGGFWDPTNRNSYGGQDSAAAVFTIYGRVPVAISQAVASFTPMSALASNGAAINLNRITFVTPLSAAQIAAIQPMLRVETNNAAGPFVAFTSRTDITDLNGNALPIVAADGSSILVDMWSRPNPAVAATPTVEPSSYDAGPYTVTVDVLHQIDQVYGGWVINPNTLPYIGTAMSWEISDFNNTRYVPSLANVLYDPRGVAVGKVLEAIDAGMTAGVGSVAFDTNGNWLAAFSARNQPSAAAPTVYGHICPYAFGVPSDGTGTYSTECFYSAGIPGHGDAIVVQPYGNSGAQGSNDPITFRVANDGTLAMAAPIVMTGAANGISSGGQIRGSSFISPGLMVSQSVAQLNSPTTGTVYTSPASLGRLFVTGPSGTFTIIFPPGPVDGQEFEIDGIGGFTGASLETSDGSGWESDTTNPVPSNTSASIAIAAHRDGVWRFNAALNNWARKS